MLARAAQAAADVRIVPRTKAGRGPTSPCATCHFFILLYMFYVKTQKNVLIWPGRWPSTCRRKKISTKNTEPKKVPTLLLKLNFHSDENVLFSQRNYGKLIAMVSLCYKREKRIESQLSKLITAKPIYADRVISCRAFIELGRVSAELFVRGLVSIKPARATRNKSYQPRNPRGQCTQRIDSKERQILTSSQMSKVKLWDQL